MLGVKFSRLQSKLVGRKCWTSARWAMSRKMGYVTQDGYVTQLFYFFLGTCAVFTRLLSRTGDSAARKKVWFYCERSEKFLCVFCFVFLNAASKPGELELSTFTKKNRQIERRIWRKPSLFSFVFLYQIDRKQTSLQRQRRFWKWKQGETAPAQTLTV